MIKTLIKFVANEGFKKYLFNASWLLVEKILRLIAGLFVGIWVARYLGPKQFGLLNYVLAFISIFACLSKLGLDDIIVRELINSPDNRLTILGTGFWLKVYGALLAIIAIVLVVESYENDADTKLFILIISVGLFLQSFEVVEFYFRSRVLARFVSICKITQLVVSSSLKIFFVFYGYGLLFFVLLTLIDSITLAVSLYVSYRYNLNDGFFKYFDFSLAIRFLRDSWPLIFSSLVVMIYMRLDQIMIKELLGEAELGIYSASVRLTEVWYFIPTIIASSIFPAILNAKKISEDLYRERFQKLYTFMVWLAIGIAFPMTFGSTWLIKSLFGPAYVQAGEVLVIQIWSGIFVFLGISSGLWLTAENMQIVFFRRTFWGMVVSIFLNLLLIPKFRLIGAAFSSLMSHFVAALVYDLFDSRTRPMFWMKIKAFCFRLT